MNTAADLVEQSVHETLTYYAFPDIHWQNPHQQSSRADHERQSAAEHVSLELSPIASRASTWRQRGYVTSPAAWSAKCYMNMRPLYQPQLMQTEAVA